MSEVSVNTYRKRPLEVQAIRWTGDNIDEVRSWAGAEFVFGPCVIDNDLLIDTLEGQMRADVGDWIIRGVKGEFYPCKPDIFAATYDLVSGSRDEKNVAVSAYGHIFTPDGVMTVTLEYGSRGDDGETWFYGGVETARAAGGQLTCREVRTWSDPDGGRWVGPWRDVDSVVIGT